MVAESYTWDLRVAVAIRFVHRLVSGLAVLTCVALAVVVAMGWSGVRRWPDRAVGIGLVVTTWAASFTGYLLPWACTPGPPGTSTS